MEDVNLYVNLLSKKRHKVSIVKRIKRILGL
ncbi:hypothetical protein U728_777 [Clostridium botulinum 202F]|nr:hypothetical protein U728_777 [Clostridium botulinum 202F]